MPQVIAISGSPSPTSKSARILETAVELLESQGIRTETFSVRDVPAEDLFHTRFDSPLIQKLSAGIAKAQAVVVASPIYKASYPGVFKALLDLLPQKTLQGKIVLPVATGGSQAHLLAIDYAYKPVFSALGATHLLQGVYVTDGEIQVLDSNQGGGIKLAEDPQRRLQNGISELIEQVRWREYHVKREKDAEVIALRPARKAVVP